MRLSGSGNHGREGSARRRRRLLVLLLALGAAGAYALTSLGAPVVPVPEPIVMVRTESGGIVRETAVPVGGIPVPINVDSGSLPDVDVSVGLVAVEELPNVLVPNVVVRRNLLAVQRGDPSPPLKLDARIVLLDAASASRLATVDYGFETPPGARMPPVVRTKLVGPPTGGFVDPLVAKIETPGYRGPLKFNVKVATATFEGTFALKFDPLPEAITVTEDPRDDGLDLVYDHTGATSEVKLDASADLRDPGSGRRRHVGAVVERLPKHIQLSHRSTRERTAFEYRAGSELGKPDVEADYRDTLGDGTVIADANVKLSGLPSHVLGTVATRPAASGTDIDGVRVEVPGGGQIDAVDFVARNWLGDPGNLPEYQIGPEHFVSMASRRQADGSSRFRMAGRLLGVRDIGYLRSGPERDKLDVSTDIGDGEKPLRGILDIDDRATPAVKGQKRHFVDTTVAPLPSTLNVLYEPATGSDPLRLVYDSTEPVDVDTQTVIAEGAADDCGEDRVVCADASVEDLPPHIDVKVPGKGGTDFSVSHTAEATQRPDVRATVDLGPDSTEEPPSERKWLRAGLEGIPNEVRGRMDTGSGELRAAEFHGCRFDFSSGECTGDVSPIDDVTFTVRDRPSRAGLPPRPDVPEEYVTLVSRHTAPAPKRFEVAGHVAAVRSVVFHQMDLEAGDGKTDGILGARVDVGTGGKPFAVAVDDDDDAFDESETPPVKIGREVNEVRVDVDPLPPRFSACVRSSKEVAPPDPEDLPRDPLLAPCQSTDVVTPAEGEHAVTPLTAFYSAKDADGAATLPKVHATLKSTKPDLDDLDALDNPFPVTTFLDLDVGQLPGTLRADVIPPITPEPTATPPVAGRRLQAVYDADSKIPVIDLDLQHRRATSICEDPRQNRKSLCLKTTLKDLPSRIATTYDPDDRTGLVDITSTPASDGSKLSILPLHLAKVSPERTSKPLVLDAQVKGITKHLVGHIQERELDGESLAGRPTLAEQLASCSNGIDDDSDHDAGDPDPASNVDANDDDCKNDPARLSFDACPPDPESEPCDGVETISFTATDQLVPDPQPGGAMQPPGPPPVVPPDPTVGQQEFSFVQSGEYRARGALNDFKRLSYSKLEDDGSPSRVTRISAGLGNGEPLSAHIDRDTGRKTERLDALITDAPEEIDICLREPTNAADLDEASDDFCQTTLADSDDRPDAGKMALQAKLGGTHGEAKPDIDVSRFELSKGGGFEVLTGSIDIQNLTKRIDVLVGKDDGTEVRIEGHNADDERGDPPVAVADRVTFAIRNFRDVLGLSGYPWEPATPGAVDPKNDSRNDDGTRRNYLQLAKNHDGRLLAEGSVPDIRRIHLAPRPCDPDSPLTPTSGFGSRPLPDYKCIEAIVAPGRPFGFAVRTLDGNPGGIDIPADLEAFDVEEGHVTRMPDSLAISLGKSPDSQKGLPRCADPAPAPCRPPLISLEAPGDEPRGQLQARLASGNTADLEALRQAEPDDVLSRRVGFEQAPKDSGFATGARVKVGTNEQTGESALRVAAKLDLPRFLDLDPFAQFDCTHTVVNPNPATECDEEEVGSEFNRGYETRDMLFRLVAADDEHFGNPPASKPRLGRVALMAEPLFTQSPKAQIVLSGMPQPDHKDPVLAQSATGASSSGSGRLPDPADPSNRGFDAPAHVDARLHFRNDFNSGDEDGDPNGRAQTKYTQIDGRVNVPLSMAVRVNERPPLGEEALKKFSPSLNRDRNAVPTTQLSLFNAPSSNNADAYAAPTFRVRAELRKGFQSEKSEEGFLGPFICGGFDGPFCLVVPNEARLRYLDVQMNADPASSGATTTAGAARTVDATGGPFGGESNIDLRGFREIRPPGDKGPVANITPAAAARLTNFNVGLRADIGLGGLGVRATYEMLGDLVLGLAGPSVDRTRLSQNKTSLELKSEDGSGPGASRVMTSLIGRQHLQLTARLLFGSIDLFNLKFAPFHQPVLFSPCQAGGLIGIEDTFGTTDRQRAAMSLSLSSIFGAGVTNAPLAFLSDRFKFLGCTSLFGTDVSELVSRNNATANVKRSPAPGYSVPGHGVPDQEVQLPPSLPPQPLPEHTPGEDLTVPGPVDKLCGTYTFGKVTVSSGGTLTVGAPGETDDKGNACDGSLAIDADVLDVTSGGSIVADEIRDGVGGRIEITASKFVNDGEISALGGPGDDVEVETGGACLTGGTGRQGGRIELSANLLEGGGTVAADGGKGGDGGIGGTGGIGGKVVLNTVAFDGLTVSAAGGEGGGTDQGYCDPGAGSAHPRQKGAKGSDGRTDEGERPDMVSDVQLSSETPGPYTSPPPKLDLKAIGKRAGGPMSIVLCHRKGLFSDPKPFGKHLDPAGNDTLAHYKLLATCDEAEEETFFQPTSGDHVYERTITSTHLLPGVYGFFAYARQPSCEDNSTPVLVPARGRGWFCFKGVTGNGTPIHGGATYTDQSVLPAVSNAKIGLDSVPPPEPGAASDGGDECFDDSGCLADAVGQVDVSASDDPGGSGLRRIECRTTPSGGSPGDWFDCSAIPTSVNLVEGFNTLDVQVFDEAGNRAEKVRAAKWFVDTTAPDAPTIALTHQGPAVNGWRKVLPTVEVVAFDPSPSAGMVDDPITVFVDEGELGCGTDDQGREDDLSTSRCHPSLAQVGEGEHRLTASAEDRLGHASGLSDPETLRTDSRSPRSRLSLGPREPDGNGGWWRSKPFIAFSASDGPAGSGVDSAKDADGAGTGIHYSVDGEPFELYSDGEDEQPIVLGDGTHDVCWYAIDLAGNREDADPDQPGEQNHCRTGITVDSTAPVVEDPIDPAQPNGGNGFYVSKPEVTPSGEDPQAPTVDISGLDRVEYQIDDGPWTAAAPFRVDEGEHEVRVRGFDVAGNPAELRERTVHVDLTEPMAALSSYPPAPNGQGLFRQERIHAVAVTDERGGSGADAASFRIDAGADAPYIGPFSVPAGFRVAAAHGSDRAGHESDSVLERSSIDVVSPAAAPSSTPPSPILINLLGIMGTTTLRYNASDGTPPGIKPDGYEPRVKVTVFVFDTLGNVVRRIPAGGSFPGGFRSSGSGSVVWDGRNDAGKGVLPGVYHYRVQAIDQAGNSIASTESPVFLVLLGVLPL